MKPPDMTPNHVTIQDFKAHLSLIREQKGFSQSQLSRYSGLDLKTIQEIETGKTEPELVVVLTLADTLEVSIKDLLDY
jgi:putative transcriptional regulator